MISVAWGVETDFVPRWTALAEAYREKGRINDGITAADEGFGIIQRSGECWWEAELRRVKGELLRERGETENAETCIRQALQIARHQQAKSLELRAAMSLARLCRYQGKRHEAHELLAPVYNWFTEGFDTKDLKEAKVLLDELS